MALAFIPNPMGLPEVNHKKGDKTDNRASELEWVSSSENIKHSYKYLNRKASDQPNRKRGVIAIAHDCAIEFSGIRECARFLGIPYQAIQGILKGKGKLYKGYSFERAK